MEQLLRFIKKYLIPDFISKRVEPAYHFSLAYLSALFYGFPSSKMTVIGVTGTKGKTTTCNLIAQILNSAGYKIGMATTVNFRIGEKEWINKTKQTMLGRFQLQKLLARMKREGCKYAVIETSSEGILQYRYRFVNYSMAVFTNLTPEHLERHGGFPNYREAKVKLFEKVAKKKNSIGIYNLDDPNIRYFLEPKIPRQYVYTLQLKNSRIKIPHLYVISEIKSGPEGTTFLLNKDLFKMPLIGEMNVYNAVSAICAAISQGIPIKHIRKILTKVKAPPGRLEMIDTGQKFKVIIDYAHEPASLEAVYKVIANLHKYDSRIFANKKIRGHSRGKLICLLGAQGGGRDKWKRAEMGKIAAKYCDKIILTNEDPYDENPLQIINDIESGFSQTKSYKLKTKNLFKVVDRREAIKKALSLAKKDDIVLLTGKGGEVWMCVEDGKKIPWDERAIVEEVLANLHKYAHKSHK